MSIYRKKPVTIDAVQLIEGNEEAIRNFWERTKCPFMINVNYTMIIRTLEDEMTANKGDWIIQDSQGVFSSCKPDIFAATYELVSTNDPED